jgi:hypothetical protein
VYTAGYANFFDTIPAAGKPDGHGALMLLRYDAGFGGSPKVFHYAACSEGEQCGTILGLTPDGRPIVGGQTSTPASTDLTIALPK